MEPRGTKVSGGCPKPPRSFIGLLGNKRFPKPQIYSASQQTSIYFDIDYNGPHKTLKNQEEPDDSRRWRRRCEDARAWTGKIYQNTDQTRSEEKEAVQRQEAQMAKSQIKSKPHKGKELKKMMEIGFATCAAKPSTHAVHTVCTSGRNMPYTLRAQYAPTSQRYICLSEFHTRQRLIQHLDHSP